MIARLSLKNFRLLRSVEIEFEPDKPVVLIGPNSSGKTTVFDALAVLHRAATGAPRVFPESLATAGEILQGWVEVTIIPRRWRRNISDAESITYRIDAPEFDGAIWETMDVKAQEGTIRVLDHDKDEAKVLNRVSNEFDLLSGIPEDSSLLRGLRQPRFYPELARVADQFSAIRLYGEFLTTPTEYRDEAESKVLPADSSTISPSPVLDRRGLNLVNALYHIQNHSEEDGAWDALMGSFRAEFPFVTRLEFPVSPSGNKVGLTWRDRRYPRARLDGSQMSEGMLTYLCLLAAIYSAGTTSVLGFDEPELHLHPSALRRLVHLLEEKSRTTPVLVATHSDRLLDYLSDPAQSIHVCEPTPDGVVIRRLDADALDEWRKSYTLSEMRDWGYLDSPNADPTRFDA